MLSLSKLDKSNMRWEISVVDRQTDPNHREPLLFKMNWKSKLKQYFFSWKKLDFWDKQTKLLYFCALLGGLSPISEYAKNLRQKFKE